MAGCLELENIPTCIWFEGGDKRNALASILAGILFFSGWWIMIDAVNNYPTSVSADYHLCAIVGTISMLMINNVKESQMRSGGTFSGGCLGPRGIRAWLFMGFVLGFAAVIASSSVLLNARTEKHVWAGTGLFLQNLFILAGSLVYKFGRTEDPWS